MAVGKKVVSAFSGPADVNSFDLITHVPSSKTIKAKKSPEREELEGLYLNIRNIREGKAATTTIADTFAKLGQNHPNDWLLSVEIAELLQKENNELKQSNQKLQARLEKMEKTIASLVSQK